MLMPKRQILPLCLSKSHLLQMPFFRSLQKHCQVCLISRLTSKETKSNQKIDSKHMKLITPHSFDKHFFISNSNHIFKFDSHSIISRQRTPPQSYNNIRRNFSTSRVYFSHPLAASVSSLTDAQDLSFTKSLDKLVESSSSQSVMDVSLSGQLSDGIPAVQAAGDHLSPFLVKLYSDRGLIEFCPTVIEFFENMIYHVHSLTGVPWWAAISLAAVVGRLPFMLPLRVASDINQGRIEALENSKKFEAVTKQVTKEVHKSATSLGWPAKKQKSEFVKRIRPAVKPLYREAKCNRKFDFVTGVPQVLPWVLMSWGTRNIVTRAQNPLLEYHSVYQTMATGGTLWFTDLISPDPFFVLPVLVGATHLLNTEIHRHMHPDLSPKWLAGLRIAAVVSIKITAMFNSALVTFWLSSAATMAGINLLLMYSPFRRLTGMRVSKTETRTPIRTIIGGTHQSWTQSYQWFHLWIYNGLNMRLKKGVDTTNASQSKDKNIDMMAKALTFVCIFGMLKMVFFFNLPQIDSDVQSKNEYSN